ncbi:MAG: MBL fold metallo-hydrolase [Chromatiales bacterium]
MKHWSVLRLVRMLPGPKPYNPTRPSTLLQANRTLHTVAWIGHSTVLVQTGGCNLITDPMFSRRASPLPFAGPRRHQPPGIALRDLPPIDLVLISHNHYDHLDLPSVRALSRRRGGPHRAGGRFRETRRISVPRRQVGRFLVDAAQHPTYIGKSVPLSGT